MLYLVAPLWIFSPRIWQDVQLWGSCACANKIPKQQYLWTWCQSVVPNDAPRDFGPEVAFGAKFQIPVARQGGREMSAPRPYVTDPFRPLSSLNSWKQFLYIQQHSSYFLHVVRSSVSRSGAHLTTADALFMVHIYYKSCVFPYGTPWCILAQNTLHPRMCIHFTNKKVLYLV